ncbi:tigr02452 family protein [Apiospora arundinis]|uniref:Tigr02452 family protein n=1 Tax=Apiospora arundinis TaxID=335852 RepID=A0ABR2HSQ8_9PEZI
MGRTEPSVGQPPAAFRKDVRAKKAKATLNKTIPALLSAHPRARRGNEAAELIANPSALKAQPDDSKASPKDSTIGADAPRLILQAADTLTVAHRLLENPDTGRMDLGNKEARVGILNMASPLSPGGGFLNGAGSQEEYLCMRTTLLPSLKDEFYRLPELGGVYTPDVLVFRDDAGDDLEKKDRWFVDCVSAGMLRFPDVSVDEETGRGSYALAKDRELVQQKMRSVLRMFQAKKVRNVVLGAWGCGAYGNPVGEVAAAWKRVLLGSSNNNKQARGKNKGKGETWQGIETVSFAIKDAGMAEAFESAFGGGLTREELEEESEDELEDDPNTARVREIQDKIEQLELQVQQAKSTQLQDGLRSILTNLHAQLEKEPHRPDRASVADSIGPASDDGDSDSASDGS